MLIAVKNVFVQIAFKLLTEKSPYDWSRDEEEQKCF